MKENPDLGPLGLATEAALAAAFRGRAIVTAKTAARLIGMDVKTLKVLTNRRAIRATPRGNLDAYTESALRDYLTSPPAAAEPPKAARRPRGAPRGKVYSFNAHHRQRR